MDHVLRPSGWGARWAVLRRNLGPGFRVAGCGDLPGGLRKLESANQTRIASKAGSGRGGSAGKAHELRERVSSALDVAEAIAPGAGSLDFGVDINSERARGFVSGAARISESASLFVDAGIDNHKQWRALGGLRIRF